MITLEAMYTSVWFYYLASYGKLFDGSFIKVGCVVSEIINYAIISSYINHTFVILIYAPFVTKF